ncbi:hypothetical protein AGDE_15727 [Angomonas deanei]|uniref:EF-hand domain-containing protein n=1 Tax=Angomonas deanei TaxID=59799 RepID=A0A7G2CRM2_9TRYP|nr:hypothetical protein AGDE_15727 [Angomonas deanei]CAD2222165.1 hypothetical protein, conserved [Angomonas deanei]|eukprot:EPY18564.1 hypothetical protein AGDE_15727 [Angomonas deanei]
MVNNNSFGNTRSFDDVLLLKKQLMENPLGTSPGDHPSLTVKARADAYRIHLLYGAKTEEDGEETPKKKQVAQTRAKWSQFEELVQFVTSVCPDLSPPSPPSALLLRSGEELHGSLAHSPPGMGRSSTSNSSHEDDLVVTAEEREMRKDYMAEYLNYILQKKEASCLREVQTFVGYAQFVQGERHQARYRRHEAKEKPGPSPQDRLKSDHSDSSGRRTKKKLSKRSKHTDKTGSDKQDPSEANQTHTKRHKSGRVQENNSFKSNSATDHGHRSRRAPVSSSSSSDDDASSSSSSSVTQSSVSFSSSSHAHSSHSHHRHNSSRGGKHDSGAKSKNNPFNTNEDYARMAEECFRMIDRHNNGYVTVGEMQWFFMCAFPAAFSHLTRLVREWSVDEGTQLGWDPWTECAPPGVTDVLPSWFKEEVGIPSHLQRQYDMQSFQSLFWRLLREGRQRSEEERTVTLEMWLDQYWILEYSWIYLSTAAVVNGQEWASFRARIRAIKEEYHKYVIQKRQAELALPGTNNSLSESPSTPSEAHPMSIRDLPQWVLSAASAAVMELPHRVRGMSPVEVLSFLFVLSESGLRLMGLEELLYWIVSQPYLQLATFTFEEMSSLLDSLSKAMPFSELLRGLTQGGLSPSSRAGGSCVLRLASRSAPTADPVVLAEIDDKIIQHSWRVRGARCVNCERTLELLHQYEKDMPQLREENLALSSQLAKALEANEELRREIQAARLSAEHHTRHGGSQKTLHDEREGLADPNGNSHSNILPDENINLSPSSSTTSNCNQLTFSSSPMPPAHRRASPW